MGDVKNLVNTEAVDKIKDLAKSADICMFTTSLSKLPLTSRPMGTAEVDDEGNIWFISQRSSDKNKEIEADNRVQLFYASKGSIEYLSIYGEATIVTDKETLKEKWTVGGDIWMKDGADDPEASMIKVKPVDSYYWDNKHNKLVALIKIAAAVITGKTPGEDDGVEGKLSM